MNKCESMEPTVTNKFCSTVVDAVLAELLEMGFPLEAILKAQTLLGSWNREELLESILKSEESSLNTLTDVATTQEDFRNDPGGTDLDSKQALVPVKQEVDEYSNYKAPQHHLLAVEVEPGETLPSTSARASERNQMNRKIGSLNGGLEISSLKTSRKSSLLQRLIEMGCRPDVAVKAYEIYGTDPTYKADDERLDVMCDYIAAVDLNGEEIEGEDEEIRDFTSSEEDVGIQDWFSFQSEVEDNSETVHAQNHSQSRCQPAPYSLGYPRGQQEEYKEEYSPGGYYRYVREDDPDLEEHFSKDLEEQEGLAVHAVKRRKIDDEASPSTSLKRIRPHATKSLLGLVTRRIRVPHYTNMTGYGVPGLPMIRRKLPERSVDGPPYFYFENVAFMPGDEWDIISRHLYDIEPEFVNAYHFTVCKRPRGYVHNLPVEGRFEIIPRAPRTIKELVPYSSNYWPSWDDRTKFNCICTTYATECTIKPVMKLLECLSPGREPPAQIRRQLMDLLRMYNMVWIGPGRVARPKVEELEVCMGFDPDHTRPIMSMNQQIKGLGNAFQVHTVGYHLSVLKNLYPKGLNVLSLFSGIGGAEVAMHKLGIVMHVAVCVEIDPKARRVIEHWWQITHQTGKLITKYEDVNQLDYDTLQKLIVEVGGFDLVIGGSPCSNLSAKNRFTRMGLGGKASVAFFEYSRILKDVRTFGLQQRRQQHKFQV